MATLTNLAMRLKWDSAARASNLPAAFLLTDTDRLPDPEGAIAGLPKNTGVIFRHYGAPNREALGRRLWLLCRQKKIPFLVAGDIRLAARLRADGVHLPEALARHARAAKRYRRGWLVTVAAHGGAALHKAAASGADAVLLSPVFPTQSHPGARALGPVRFARLCHDTSLPVFALGGVNAVTARHLKDSGAAGVAAISGLVPANHPPSSGQR